MNPVVNNIQKKIRIEVLDALEDVGLPMRPSTLIRHCDSAADIDDIMTALRRLSADRLVVRSDDGYALPNASAPRDQKAREAGPQPIGKPTDAIAAVLAANGDWMTIAEIESHVSGLNNAQIHGAMKSRRFQSRKTERGAPRAREYGLADWPATDAERATVVPNADGSQLAEYDLADLENDTVQPETAEEPIAPASPLTSKKPRFGLFSDGALSIENTGGYVVDLEPEETRQLIEYLVACRPQVSALFDEQIGGAS